jgi:hypothetical protein
MGQITLLPTCIYETPVWRVLLYKEKTVDPALITQPFTLNTVNINGVGYTKYNDLDDVRANPGSWNQDGETLYIHYPNGNPPDLSQTLSFT